MSMANSQVMFPVYLSEGMLLGLSVVGGLIACILIAVAAGKDPEGSGEIGRNTVRVLIAVCITSTMYGLVMALLLYTRYTPETIRAGMHFTVRERNVCMICAVMEFLGALMKGILSYLGILRMGTGKQALSSLLVINSMAELISIGGLLLFLITFLM